MQTLKEILTENRNSVISSIKYSFKIWKNEDVKAKMIEFFAFATENADVERLSNSKRVKTDLKDLVIKMNINQTRATSDAYNMRVYGNTNPSLRDVMGKSAERNEDNGLVWHPIYKSWVKNENAFSSMAK